VQQKYAETEKKIFRCVLKTEVIVQQVRHKQPCISANRQCSL